MSSAHKNIYPFIRRKHVAYLTPPSAFTNLATNTTMALPGMGGMGGMGGRGAGLDPQQMQEQQMVKYVRSSTPHMPGSETHS